MLDMAGESDLSFFKPLIDPWYKSLKDPGRSQSNRLFELIEGYSRTRYGKIHHASEVEDSEGFRRSFPILDYSQLRPYLAEIKRGDYASILPEPPASWVMTRGSTGPAKVIPVTREHLEEILTCGSRAFINYVLRKQDTGILDGRILNLNFPSSVHTMNAGGETETYGYSSGTYARLNPALGKVGLLPRQEDIDALGPGISKADWDRRFELAYQQSLGENITAAMGVTPVILSFARYVRERHRKMPKQLWNLHALFCTSVRKIQFKYAPKLRKYFGQIPVVEMYSATEGVFAQQLDDLPYVTPNYDKYLFEVKTRKGIKMLHELERGEWGSLVVSSCLYPRYDIGDIIEAAGKNYFRVVGRRKKSTLLEHKLYRLFFGAFL
jgi:hypothetical protein